MALFHYYFLLIYYYYHDTATVRNQHQLLTCKISKWHSLLFLKTTMFVLSKTLRNAISQALSCLKVTENLSTII